MSRDPRVWSPFQSREVREICANLTDDELAEFLRRSASVHIVIAMASSVLLLSAMFYFPGAFYIVVCVVVAILIACTPTLQKRQKEFLCSTAWATAQGYTPDKLKLLSLR